MNNTNPKYYKSKCGKYELMDVIDAFDLDRYESAIVQYIFRRRHKNGIEDLMKAKWYLNRLIDNEKSGPEDESHTQGPRGSSVTNTHNVPIKVIRIEDCQDENGFSYEPIKTGFKIHASFDKEYADNQKKIEEDVYCRDYIDPYQVEEFVVDVNWIPASAKEGALIAPSTDINHPKIVRIAKPGDPEIIGVLYKDKEPGDFLVQVCVMDKEDE